MRGWNPESEEDPAERLPPEQRLPDPGWSYTDIEVMKAFGCWDIAAWRAQSPDQRAELIAHEIHKGLRERWNTLKLRAQARKASGAPAGKPLSQAPWDVIARQFQGGSPA